MERTRTQSHRQLKRLTIPYKRSTVQERIKDPRSAHIAANSPKDHIHAMIQLWCREVLLDSDGSSLLSKDTKVRTGERQDFFPAVAAPMGRGLVKHTDGVLPVLHEHCHACRNCSRFRRDGLFGVVVLILAFCDVHQ